MVESGIVAVLHLMEGLGIDESNVDRYLSQTLTEYESGEFDDELYFLKVASILSNARAGIDRVAIERIFLPWKVGELERCGGRYSFWLLLEQLSYYAKPTGNSEEFYEWLDENVGNAVVFSDEQADRQLMLMLDNDWFSDRMRNRICLWIFYNVVLGEMRSRTFPQDLLKAAANHTSHQLGRGGLAKEILAFKLRSEGGGIADN